MILDTEIKGVMSHEASAALNTFLIDLPESEKVFFTKWKARKGSGVPQIQEVLAIDRTRSHPFRRDPKTGNHLIGRPRHYLVVADEQGELYYDNENRLRVRQPTNEKGLARLRAEIPEFNEYASDSHKIFDDAVDAWRGEAAGFFVSNDPLSLKEEQELSLPQHLREDVIAKGADNQAERIHARTHWLAEIEIEKVKVDDDDPFYLDV